jgi:hypothetical protein
MRSQILSQRAGVSAAMDGQAYIPSAVACLPKNTGPPLETRGTGQ